MKDQDYIRLLHYYRHDFLNQLQIVQGYLSMDHIDKVKIKVDEWMDHLSEEKKLMNLNAPQFIIWVMQINHIQEAFRLSYQINLKDKDLLAIDQSLIDQCKIISNKISELGDQNTLYNIDIQLTEQSNASIYLTISVNGNMDKQHHIINNILKMLDGKTVDIEKTKNGFICKFLHFV